jgi:hypothetical protein
MKAIVVAVLLTVGATAVVGWMLDGETASDLLTPEPERVVQSFVSALAARRAVSAEQHLAPGVRHEETREKLRAAAAAERLRFEDANVLRHGDVADVHAQLSTPGQPRIERRFRLMRDAESRLWKITEFQ